MANPVKRQAFKEWLQSKNPTDVIGFKESATSCPIATFLREKTEYIDATVERDSILVSRPIKQSFRLLWWQENFIERADGSYDDEITAGRALDMLAKGPIDGPSRLAEFFCDSEASIHICFDCLVSSDDDIDAVPLSYLDEMDYYPCCDLCGTQYREVMLTEEGEKYEFFQLLHRKRKQKEAEAARERRGL